MKNWLRKQRKAKKMAMLVLTMALTVAMCAVVFAADPPAVFDLNAAISSGLTEMQTTVLSIIGVIVPSIMAVMAVTITLKKGMGLVKSLFNKA